MPGDDDSDDDLDIYSDLPNFQYDETLKKLESANKSQTNQVETLKKKLEELAKKNEQLESVNKALSINISSLYKTASTEIQRKDRMLTELRREKESIIFRRGKKYHKHKERDDHYEHNQKSRDEDELHQRNENAAAEHDSQCDNAWEEQLDNEEVEQDDENQNWESEETSDTALLNPAPTLFSARAKAKKVKETQNENDENKSDKNKSDENKSTLTVAHSDGCSVKNVSSNESVSVPDETIAESNKLNSNTVHSTPSKSNMTAIQLKLMSVSKTIIVPFISPLAKTPHIVPFLSPLAITPYNAQATSSKNATLVRPASRTSDTSRDHCRPVGGTEPSHHNEEASLRRSASLSRYKIPKKITSAIKCVNSLKSKYSRRERSKSRTPCRSPLASPPFKMQNSSSQRFKDRISSRPMIKPSPKDYSVHFNAKEVKSVPLDKGLLEEENSLGKNTSLSKNLQPEASQQLAGTHTDSTSLTKVSPSYMDPAVLKDGNVSMCFFNEHCDFKQRRKKRFVKLKFTNENTSPEASKENVTVNDTSKTSGSLLNVEVSESRGRKRGREESDEMKSKRSKYSSDDGIPKKELREATNDLQVENNQVKITDSHSQSKEKQLLNRDSKRQLCSEVVESKGDFIETTNNCNDKPSIDNKATNKQKDIEDLEDGELLDEEDKLSKSTVDDKDRESALDVQNKNSKGNKHTLNAGTAGSRESKSPINVRSNHDRIPTGRFDSSCSRLRETGRRDLGLQSIKYGSERRRSSDARRGRGALHNGNRSRGNSPIPRRLSSACERRSPSELFYGDKKMRRVSHRKESGYARSRSRSNSFEEGSKCHRSGSDESKKDGRRSRRTEEQRKDKRIEEERKHSDRRLEHKSSTGTRNKDRQLQNKSRTDVHSKDQQLENKSRTDVHNKDQQLENKSRTNVHNKDQQLENKSRTDVHSKDQPLENKSRTDVHSKDRQVQNISRTDVHNKDQQLENKGSTGAHNKDQQLENKKMTGTHNNDQQFQNKSRTDVHKKDQQLQNKSSTDVHNKDHQLRNKNSTESKLKEQTKVSQNSTESNDKNRHSSKGTINTRSRAKDQVLRNEDSTKSQVKDVRCRKECKNSDEDLDQIHKSSREERKEKNENCNRTSNEISFTHRPNITTDEIELKDSTKQNSQIVDDSKQENSFSTMEKNSLPIESVDTLTDGDVQKAHSEKQGTHTELSMPRGDDDDNIDHLPQDIVPVAGKSDTPLNATLNEETTVVQHTSETSINIVSHKLSEKLDTPDPRVSLPVLKASSDLKISPASAGAPSKLVIKRRSRPCVLQDSETHILASIKSSQSALSGARSSITFNNPVQNTMAEVRRPTSSEVNNSVSHFQNIDKAMSVSECNGDKRILVSTDIFYGKKCDQTSEEKDRNNRGSKGVKSLKISRLPIHSKKEDKVTYVSPLSNIQRTSKSKSRYLIDNMCNIYSDSDVNSDSVPCNSNSERLVATPHNFRQKFAHVFEHYSEELSADIVGRDDEDDGISSSSVSDGDSDSTWRPKQGQKSYRKRKRTSKFKNNKK